MSNLTKVRFCSDDWGGSSDCKTVVSAFFAWKSIVMWSNHQNSFSQFLPWILSACFCWSWLVYCMCRFHGCVAAAHVCLASFLWGRVCSWYLGASTGYWCSAFLCLMSLNTQVQDPLWGCKWIKLKSNVCLFFLCASDVEHWTGQASSYFASSRLSQGG